MAKSKRFRVLSNMPAGVRAGGMHPDTKAIIAQIKATKGRVLEATMKSPREGKARQDALRRARARKRVQYKELRREGAKLYVQLR